MTEKRFVFREDYEWWEIKDTTGQIKGDYDEWFSCEKVVDLLNTLSDENEQLKEELDYFRAKSGSCEEGLFKKDREIAKLEKENKELKKQMNRLYNYFWDWHSDEMEGNQFSEMWDGVKKSKRWDEGW